MSAQDIVRRVCAARGVPMNRLRDQRKSTMYVTRVRHEAMWLLRQFTPMSLEEIARATFRNDHTSTLNGLSKMWREIKARPEYGADLRAMVTG